MKDVAITVRQPLASLIVWGAIRHHVEDWGIRRRGPIAIHAAAVPWQPADLGAIGADLQAVLKIFRASNRLALASAIHALPRNAIVGTVDVADCVRIHSSAVAPDVSAIERAFGDFRPGRVEWFLRDGRELEASEPLRGGSGLWDLQLARARQ